MSASEFIRVSATAAPRTGCRSQVRRPPAPEFGIAGHGGCPFLQTHRPSPLLRNLFEEFLALCFGWSPGIALVADALGIGADHDQGRGAFRVGGRKERRHGAALGDAAQGGTLRTGRVHDGPDVVHALLQGGQPVERHPVGKAGTPFVEKDQPGEGRQPAQESGEGGLGPEVLEVRHPAHHEDQVQRTVAQHLVGDVDVATTSVVGGRNTGVVGESGRSLFRPGDEAIAAAVRCLDDPRLLARVRQHFSYLGDCNFQHVAAYVYIRPYSLE